MQFNSLEFFLFLVLFLGIWPFLVQRNNLRWIYLTLASFVFYGWWDWRFLFLIIASGLLDFCCGLGMGRFPRRKKWLLIASIIGNLGALGAFKYLDFFIANVNSLLASSGFNYQMPLAGLILPIGISFYTFQSMSYTIDIYRGSLKPTRNVAHFFAYLAMFPQLVAGPIIRASDLLPQLKESKPTTEQQRWDGFRLIIHGFFKKVVIADNLAPIINAAFNNETPFPSSIYWWVIMMMFSFQIYCDFSGYSDIARGLAKWMGYEFSLNFNHPYISSSFREFWSRWHISLSTWFRDYVYYPLGGSRQNKTSGHLNMWMTMLISGLWHGSSWTFIIWGALHAFYLSLERITNRPKNIMAIPGGRLLTTLIVYLLTLIGWVFFRAEAVNQSKEILSIMFSFSMTSEGVFRNLITDKSLALLFIMFLREIYFYCGLDTKEWATQKLNRIFQPAILAFLVVASVYLRGPGNQFIYFQF